MIKEVNKKFIKNIDGEYIITPAILNDYTKYCELEFNDKIDNPHNSVGIVYNNYGDMMAEVKAWLSETTISSTLIVSKFYDAIKHETETGFLRDILPLFCNQDKHILIINTKSDDAICEPLQDNKSNNIIISYNVSSYNVCAELEPMCPNPFQRLSTALIWHNRGYDVNINIEPIIPIVNFDDEYSKICDIIMNHKLPRVSIGVLKTTQAIKDNDKNNIFKYEIESCKDGYMRMPEKVRAGIYRWFRRRLSDIKIVINEDVADMII